MFVCASLDSIGRSDQGGLAKPLKEAIHDRNAVVYCGYGVDFSALGVQVEGAASCRIFTKFGPSESFYHLAERRGYEINSTSGVAGKVVERALSSGPDVALFLFLTRSQLARSPFLDGTPTNSHRIFVCESEEEMPETIDLVEKVLKEASYSAVSVNSSIANKSSSSIKEYVANNAINGSAISKEIDGKDVVIVSESPSNVMPLVKLASKASSTEVLISREPIEEELRAESIESLHFLRYGVDIAAPYTLLDVRAATMAMEHAEKLVNVMFARLSTHSDALRAEIKEHLALSLEDSLYSLFRRHLASVQLVRGTNSVFLVQTNGIRLATLMGVYSAAREVGADVYLCASRSPSSSKNFIKLLERLGELVDIQPGMQSSFGASLSALFSRLLSTYPRRRRAGQGKEPLRIAELPNVGGPSLAAGDALILAAGDRNYSDTVHAVSKVAAGSRAVQVWSIGDSYDPAVHGVLDGVAVERIRSAKLEANLNKKTEGEALEFAKVNLPPKALLDPETAILTSAGFALWFTNTLPFLCDWYKAARQRMTTARPAYLIACNGRNPLSRLAIQAAKVHDIPTLDVQAVLLSDYVRIKKPITDYVSVLESMSQDLMQHHFGLGKDRIFRSGSPRIQSLLGGAVEALDLKSSHQPPAGPHSKTVLLATQPLDSTLSMDAAQHVLNTVARIPGARLLIRLHPREGVATRRRYAELIARKGASEYCELLPKGPLIEALEKAVVVVTFFSNVGLEAALLGKDILALALDGHFPMDFRRGGMAMAANTPDEIDAVLQAYLNDAEYREKVRRDRLRFLESNEQLFRGNPGERIVDAMETIISPMRAVSAA